MAKDVIKKGHRGLLMSCTGFMCKKNVGVVAGWELHLSGGELCDFLGVRQDGGKWQEEKGGQLRELATLVRGLGAVCGRPRQLWSQSP